MSTQWAESSNDTARIVPGSTKKPSPRPPKRGVPHHLTKDTPREQTAAYLVRFGGTGDAPAPDDA